MFVNTPFPLFTRPTGYFPNLTCNRFILATYAATAVAGIPLWSKLRKSVPSVTIVAIVLALNVVLAAVLVGSGAHDVRRNFSLKALLDHPVPQQMLFVGMFHRCGRLEHQAELFKYPILPEQIVRRS